MGKPQMLPRIGSHVKSVLQVFYQQIESKILTNKELGMRLNRHLECKHLHYMDCFAQLRNSLRHATCPTGSPGRYDILTHSIRGERILEKDTSYVVITVSPALGHFHQVAEARYAVTIHILSLQPRKQKEESGSSPVSSPNLAKRELNPGTHVLGTSRMLSRSRISKR